MQDVVYDQILVFLTSGIIPKDDEISSRSNFRTTANKYEVTGSGILMRNGKEVVKKSMQGKKLFFNSPIR